MASEEVKDPAEAREGLLHLAQCTMKAKDYRYMLGCMKRLIQIVMPTEDLSENERDCFSSACNLLVDVYLNSWRHLDFVEADVASSLGRRESAREYKEMVADEIAETCAEIVEFINRSVLFTGEGVGANSMTTESRVFYKKMKGDYLRHIAMAKKGLERVEAVEAVFEAYNAAMEEALELPEANLTRLKLALNMAVFHAEICESLNEACSVAREAVDLAKRSLEIKGEEISSETTEALEELQSNIGIWMAKMEACKSEVTTYNS